MAKTEERFCGKAPVSELKNYLKDMRKNIRKKIEKEKVKDSAKATNFVRLIEDVLELPYFDMEVDVYTLMGFLKEDTTILARQISSCEKQLEEAKNAVEAIKQEPDVSPSYAVPDEWREQYAAKQQRLKEARENMYAINTVIEEFKRERMLVQRLKGMICRPKGFFANL